MKVINPIQEKIIKNFGAVKDSGQFYLTGGTALACFYLKHRQSNDLDFFTSVEEIIESLSHQLEKHLATRGFECKRQTASKFLKLKEGTIITYDEEDRLKHQGIDIKIVPIWKWLLIFSL